MTFYDHFSNKVDAFNTHLFHDFEFDDDRYKNAIKESMLYSLKCGGKRLRPLFLMEFGKAFGASEDDTIDFAIAMEMIHTYSLIHDDLPAMDNDDFRRGKPTNHKVFGESTAILAGDGLLNLSFEKMIKKTMTSSDPLRYLHAMDYIAKASGIQGMITGQIADIKNENAPFDVDTLNYINQYKTGALFKASMVAGAIIGGASQEQIRIVEEAASLIGLSFQIKDDILDIIGEEAIIGKPLGSDEKNMKVTYPNLMGLEEANHKVLELTFKATNLIESLHRDTNFIIQCFEYMSKRNH